MKNKYLIVSFITLLLISFLIFTNKVNAYSVYNEYKDCDKFKNNLNSLTENEKTLKQKYDSGEIPVEEYNKLQADLNEKKIKTQTSIDNCEEWNYELGKKICESKSSFEQVNCLNDLKKGVYPERPTSSLSIVNSNKTDFVCSDVKYLTRAWLLIRVAAPFLIVLFGSLDFIKAVMAGDEKKMKESKTKFIKRLIAFLLLIVLPFVVQFIFENMGTYGSENVCLVRCIATNNTSSKGCD